MTYKFKMLMTVIQTFWMTCIWIGAAKSRSSITRYGGVSPTNNGSRSVTDVRTSCA